MKLLQTEITPLTKELILFDYRTQAFLSSPFHKKPSFHAHPELELVYIEKGFGKRIIHNKIERFDDGDMVLIGPHVPHVWLSDPAFYDKDSDLESKVFVTYINPTIFDHLFKVLKELDEIKVLFQEAQKGIRIYGKTREIIAQYLKETSGKEGFEKIQALLKVMYVIATSQEKAFIDEKCVPVNEPGSSERLIAVLNYMNEHFNEDITLKEVADIACMTEPSLSRLFKMRMKVTFSSYLQNIRINKSLDLLVQTDDSIADIAEACGYKSSPHFCKVFKEHTGKSPLQYKREIRET